MISLPLDFYPNERIETWLLFDLRDARAAEALRLARALWQGQSDIQALDEHHFALTVRPESLSGPTQ
jgi:hypothetical protein